MRLKDKTFGDTVMEKQTANGEYAIAYSLKSLSYPTGKTASFHYEPNEYYYAGSRIVGKQYAGGLRTKILLT